MPRPAADGDGMRSLRRLGAPLLEEVPVLTEQQQQQLQQQRHQRCWHYCSPCQPPPRGSVNHVARTQLQVNLTTGLGLQGYVALVTGVGPSTESGSIENIGLATAQRALAGGLHSHWNRCARPTASRVLLRVTSRTARK